MGIIAEGFNIGNINLSSKYCMTQAQIDAIGDGEGYPDVFPIWNVDNEKLYVFYRTTEGVPNICRIDEVPGSIEVPVLYPTINPETNVLTWEIKELTSQVPDPVTLMGGQDGHDGDPGADGKSAYEIWLELGNEGTEEDFIDSLKGEKGDTGDATDISSWTDAQIRQLKERMGIPEILDAIDNLQLLVANLADRVTIIERQLHPIDPDDGGEESDDDNPDDPGSGGGDTPSGGDDSGEGGEDTPGSDDGGDDSGETPSEDNGTDTDDTPVSDSDSSETNTEEVSGNEDTDNSEPIDNNSVDSGDDLGDDSDITGDFGDEDNETETPVETLDIP